MEIWGIEPIVLVGMAFSLIVLLMIGGFVAVIPLFRRLAKAIDVWLDQRKVLGPELRELEAVRSDLEELGARIEATESRLELVAERQEFVEKLLEGEAAVDPADRSTR